MVQGANLAVTPQYLDEKRAILEGADYLVMQLEISYESVLHAARWAKAAGKTVILDPAPAPEHAPEELWELVDIVKPNESELRTLAGGGDAPVEELCRRLREKCPGKILVTMGSRGALLYEAPDRTLLVPNCPARVVDTTAAGDSFLGALTVSLSRGKSLPEAIGYGCRVAAVTVSRPGAQESIPTAEEMEHWGTPQG